MDEYVYTTGIMRYHDYEVIVGIDQAEHMNTFFTVNIIQAKSDFEAMELARLWVAKNYDFPDMNIVQIMDILYVKSIKNIL